MAKQDDAVPAESAADQALEEEVVRKLRSGVAQTDLTPEELAAWERVEARS